ncbi:unnamed protein product [Tenebrio molitor]|nr:unnamed protein product [Tenebrio molitor]
MLFGNSSTQLKLCSKWHSINCKKLLSVDKQSDGDTHRFDFRAIFEDECETNKKIFITQDDVRKDLYISFSNTKNVSLKCSTLVNRLISYADKIIITSKQIELDLLSILMNGAERITDEYEYEELTPMVYTELRQPLFTELHLAANFNRYSNKTAIAYAETENKSIGKQHIMYTTNPGSISDSSSSGDLLENDDSESNSSFAGNKKRKTCQKAGNFDLSGHIRNSHFNDDVKCHVEIFILVENEGYCKTLAKHLGLIWFEDLLEGEEHIERRLLRHENKIYRLAHTETIKKMMKGYSSICITASESAWQLSSANVKGVIYTENSKFDTKSFEEEVNYCILVDNNILCFVDAISKIIQKYLLCNVSVKVNYEMPEKAYTKIHLPITVFIPLYIVRYFSQSFLVTRERCPNPNVVDIFQSKPNHF